MHLSIVLSCIVGLAAATIGPGGRPWCDKEKYPNNNGCPAGQTCDVRIQIYISKLLDSDLIRSIILARRALHTNVAK